MTRRLHVYDPPLVRGRLLRRYKRFLADVALDDGRDVLAHCPSPGAMTGLAEPGSVVWLAPVTGRKLAWSWKLATDGGVLVAFDGVLANRLVARAIADGLVPELGGYREVQREAALGAGTRVDLRLVGHPDDPRPCWVEVKTVTLGGEGGVARFPDAPTERGRKHLAALSEVAARGDRAALVYLVQRADARAVTAAVDVDPAYASGLRAALDAGVTALAVALHPDPGGLTFAGLLPVLAEHGPAS